jgi:hypothetical protein
VKGYEQTLKDVVRAAGTGVSPPVIMFPGLTRPLSIARMQGQPTKRIVAYAKGGTRKGTSKSKHLDTSTFITDMTVAEFEALTTEFLAALTKWARNQPL